MPRLGTGPAYVSGMSKKYWYRVDYSERQFDGELERDYKTVKAYDAEHAFERAWELIDLDNDDDYTDNYVGRITMLAASRGKAAR